MRDLDVYRISESKNYYKVTNVEDVDATQPIKVYKNEIEELQTGMDEERIAILLAVIEEARFKCSKNIYEREKMTCTRRFIKRTEFKEKLNVLLLKYTVEDIVSEIEDMTYYEMEDFFTKESKEDEDVDKY